jgi:hypothetical protein
MTDRELLERAAHAAGYGDGHYEDGSWLEVRYGYTAALYLAHDDVDGYWNPLEHDGQALRLANKLELTIRHIAGAVIVRRHEEVATTERHCMNDVDAATRRAIVRAVASLGPA